MEDAKNEVHAIKFCEKEYLAICNKEKESDDVKTEYEVYKLWWDTYRSIIESSR